MLRQGVPRLPCRNGRSSYVLPRVPAHDVSGRGFAYPELGANLAVTHGAGLISRADPLHIVIGQPGERIVLAHTGPSVAVEFAVTFDASRLESCIYVFAVAVD
jgi:hypothetical protein